MRLNTINRQMSEMIDKIDSIKLRQSLPLIEQINSYNCKIKDAKKQIYIASFNKVFISLVTKDGDRISIKVLDS